MPQDSLRSVVYRSFVTCDDPKGVVEGTTIRKSKTDSQKMEAKSESQRQPKDLLIKSSSYKGGDKEIVCKKATEELDNNNNNPSSCQLMEVKKGAQKLNQVIDSWSKGVSFEGQSKDIAKDLLRGALDLQESLTMLGKLQEASEYMAKFKKRHKEKVNEIGLERVGSERIESRNYQKGFQKPRMSVDDASRDCYEELRNVIRDSLARQNLLPYGSSDERAYLERRKKELSPDLPSTSSSRSSVAHSYEFASSDSLSSKMPEEKPKGSNLIAKLMGLEEVSSKSLQSTPQKQLERDKPFNVRRPVFDIDLPMTRKPQFLVPKVDREPMTLDKIIEVMRSKGLLKSTQHQSHHSNTSYLEKRFGDDAPPIVIMKPHHQEELHVRKFQQEARVLENDKARNWKSKEDFPSKIKKVDVMHDEETSIKKTHKEKGTRDFKEKVRKTECEEVKIHKEKRTSDTKERVGNAEGEKVKIKGRPSSTIAKASGDVSPKPQKKEVVKNVDKIQKLAPSRKKPLEMENVKPKSPKTREQEKVTLSKQTKSEARSNIVKCRQISQQKDITSKHSSLQKSTGHKRNVKTEKATSNPLVTDIEETGCEIDDVQIDLTGKNEFDCIATDSASSVLLLVNDERGAYEVFSKEVSCNNQHSLCDASPLTTEQDSGTEFPQEASCSTSDAIPERNCLETRNHDADEFFDINAYRAVVMQKINFHDSEPANYKLLLDCANELLEQKSLRPVPAVHPLLQKPMMKSRFSISPEQLTRNVSDGIDKLRGYCKRTKENPHGDTIHGMLERDLWWKGVVGGAWDLGWKDGFSFGEVEEVVGDLDELVLSELIENVLTDFLC